MCTRAMYQGLNGMIVTGRSMDWKEDMHSNIWLFPRGMARDGAVKQNSLSWVSKYGSVITAGYDIASTDGINEKGLVANLLVLAESEFPERDTAQNAISVSVWVQYFLDNFATVAEAVARMGKRGFQVVSGMMPDGSRMASFHLAISDGTGDSAIFEYLGGKLTIHHSKEYAVMTNSPTFDQQLAINQYWTTIGGLDFLPGTNRSADRFARASFYIGALPKTDDIQTVVAGVMSVIRNVSVPRGITTPGHPEIATTIWRAVSVNSHPMYFFESSLTPNTFWVDLKQADFNPGSPVLKLSMSSKELYHGNTLNAFKEAAPFEFYIV